MEMKSNPFALVVVILVQLVFVTPALAQTNQMLTLRLSRNFGYSSGTGRVQGTFSLIAQGPENLNRVLFMIDNQVIGEAGEPPFRVRFQTDDYPLGVHTMIAKGYTSDGGELESNQVRVEFVLAKEGWKTAAKIVVPIIGIVFGVMSATFLFPVLLQRGKRVHLPPGVQRKYGISGGGICSNCSRPYALHIYGLNFGGKKYDHCPYCGKWSLVRRSTIQDLRAAEAAELQAGKTIIDAPEISEEEKLRKQLEDSRYM